MYTMKVNQFLCQNINQVHLRLIYYGRGEVDKRWAGEVYNPVYSRLFYIVSGEGTITVNNTENITLEAGNWYLLPAGLSFEYSCDKQMDHLYFHFSLCDIGGIDLFYQCPQICRAEAKPDDLDFFTNGLDCRSVYDSLMIRQRVYDILLSLINCYGIELSARNLSPVVISSIHYIRENLSDSLSTKEIAEFCTVSPSTINKFPITFEMKRMQPGATDDWYLEVYGMDMSVKFSSSDPNAFYFTENIGSEQAWARLNVGFKPQFKTATGGIFEFGFTDAIMQMWAAFIYEIAGNKVEFGCFTPEEAVISHKLHTAALRSEKEQAVIKL